ncbi:hypothetical protein MBM_01683 [Drepanopeziza brunnea f. sp. 'multigermtubi' MB_m1]|uniref:Altered inheritance of mitochondria protein 41 n=2 Tax=Drepanopeziza brunnea f. sp. 'multigermtubi' TaxID=698441 RepID=K1X3D6_MARBU|nr:uncharacterized protein MBM_01683 [Drepanopeziza brunnea f. sp. 'multigermtubi' MB_m1]EKD19731.1 hypothetical protein MBM_01683 [Drepanopeziza brunnea f. sp. 'multigermtubi' MB_m1]
MSARPILRVSRLCTRCSSRSHYSTGTSSSSSSSTTTTTPPMLLKIRKDMKTALQAKDTPRLTVLRALLAQTLNASKTARPIASDAQVLALLRKSAAAARAASAEFRQNARPDLADKEDRQAAIMEEYTDAVPAVGEDEVRAAVQAVLDALRAEAGGKELKMGEVLKKVFAPEVLGEKPVEKGDVARIVKELMK